MLSEAARQQAQAEGLTLLVANSKTGYFGVYRHPGRPKPYEAQVKRGGKQMSLGTFATAEEAALCLARTPEGQAAAQRAAAARPLSPPLTSEEARQQAQAEGLTLLVTDRQEGGLLRRAPTSRQAQAIRAGEAWWQDGAPGHLRHRRGGGRPQGPGSR